MVRFFGAICVSSVELPASLEQARNSGEVMNVSVTGGHKVFDRVRRSKNMSPPQNNTLSILLGLLGILIVLVLAGSSTGVV